VQSWFLLQSHRDRRGDAEKLFLSSKAKLVFSSLPVYKIEAHEPVLPSRLISHRHRTRAELQPVHELQIDMLR
jgi:hypothetical protein